MDKVEVLTKTENSVNKERLRTAIWGPNDAIFKIVKEYILPIEIERQSKLFVQKVEELSKEVEELKSMNYD